MQLEVSKYLLDALGACRAVVDFTRDRTLGQYADDLMLRSAVERQLEILGEAFSRLDRIAPQYREQFPQMGQVIGMRNRIIHGYDSIDDAIVWDAIQNHVPGLLRWLQTLPL